MVVHDISSHSEFESVLKSHRVVIVDFYTDQNGLSTAFEPLYIQFSEKFEKGYFVKANVDLISNITQVQQIRDFPTIVIFLDGQVVDRDQGIQLFDPSNLQKLLHKNLELV